MVILPCCENCPFGGEIKYEVTGAPPNGITVRFINEWGNLDEFSTVDLPWSKTFRVRQHIGEEYNDGHHSDGTFTAYVSAASTARLVNLTVSIYIDGKLVQTGTSTERYKSAEAYYKIRL